MTLEEVSERIDWEDVEANPLEIILPLPMPNRPSLLSYALLQCLIGLQNQFISQNRARLLHAFALPSSHSLSSHEWTAMQGGGGEDAGGSARSGWGDGTAR